MVRASPARTRASIGSRVISLPSKKILPRSGGISPERTLASIVFPAPLGPNSPTTSPFSTERGSPRGGGEPRALEEGVQEQRRDHRPHDRPPSPDRREGGRLEGELQGEVGRGRASHVRREPHAGGPGEEAGHQGGG